MFSPTGAAPTGALRSRLRDRLTLLSADDTTENEVLANADVVVAASLGQVPAPGLLVRALGAGAVPDRRAAARLRGGASGTACCSSPATSTCSPASSSALDTRAALVDELREPRPDLAWSRVADEAEAIYERARRPAPPGSSPLKPEVRERLCPAAG